MRAWLVTGIGAVCLATLAMAQTAPARGVSLASLTWAAAEPLLTPSAVVVLPLGAGSKEHGLHLRLDNDDRLARYLAARVEAAAAVVVAPPLTYHYYPAFAEYPGSTTLSLPVARDMTADVIRSLARYGPRRFYVLNTGISTIHALEETAKLLADEGILVRYTDLDVKTAGAVKAVAQQPGGSHADEVETSMMLYIDPGSVDMSKAVRDYNPNPAGGRLTRTQGTRGTYSPTGAYGDPTLATPAKGRVITEALVTGILDDIEQLRTAPLPQARAAAGAAPARGPIAPATPTAPSGCSPGDERDIRQMGTLYSAAWRNMDAEAIAGMFTQRGDMRHPDGTIERGYETIKVNRAELFRQRAYRGSQHLVTLTDIRCLTGTLAIADGKWELRELSDDKGNRFSFSGLCTLIVRRGGAGWLIEGWRYTITPVNTPAGPTILKQPGWPGKDK